MQKLLSTVGFPSLATQDAMRFLVLGELKCAGDEVVFSFLYLKKNKISKIYVRFGKFQKYTPVALWGRHGSNVIFFLQICKEVPEEKKKKETLSPTPGATGACRPLGGRQGPFPLYKPWSPFAVILFVI